jgi:hypothetical protein
VCNTLREEHQDICLVFKENPGKMLTKGFNSSHVPQTSLPCPESIEVMTFMVNVAGGAYPL